MSKLIVFNWKMNPISLKEAKKLFEQTRIWADSMRINTDIIISPPSIFLQPLASGHKPSVRLASQNVFWENQGAYTGEISPLMLKNAGAEYVIIGHSERRKYPGETDEMVNKKVLASLKAGLKAILCVGEPAEESGIGNKESGKAKKFIRRQLERDLRNIHNSKFIIPDSSLVIAYEPVWAISTTSGAKECSPEYALEIVRFIKNMLDSKFLIPNSRILYGGSVAGKNIESFIKYKEVDGAMVGSASLKNNEIKKIIEVASKY